MKKLILNLIMIAFSLSTIAQSKVAVIYIDASNSGDKLILMQEEIKKINNNNDNVILYISNGESPLIATNKEEVEKSSVRLRMISPNYPDIRFDINKLNKELLKNNILSNIMNHTLNSGVESSIDFHFFFDKSDYESNNFKRNIIQKLLLSNNLEFNNKIHKNCKVIVHNGIKDNRSTTDIDERTFNKEKYN